jgi:hypothetical protein
MPLETRTLPARILQHEGGDEIARGWCIVAWDMVGNALPLEAWHGEIALTPEHWEAASGWNDPLFIYFHPYGGVMEPWHGLVSISPVPESDDPNRRRLRLQAAGPLTRSRYSPDELAHGFPSMEEAAEA